MAATSAPPSQPDLRAKPAQAIAAMVDTLANGLSGQLEAAAAAARATLALVAKPELQTAAAKDPLLAQRLTAVTQQANANLASLDTKKAQLQQAVLQLNKGLVPFHHT
jgi:hypothetical protein